MVIRVLVFSLLLTISRVSLAEASLQYQIYEMPLDVVAVQTIGQWQEEKLNGYFRLIITKNHRRYVTHQLWIQWICDCKQGRLTMVDVVEIGKEGPFQIVSLPEFDTRDGIGFFNLILENARTREKRRAQIQIVSRGQYRYISERLR